jgi:hypothetical protein
VRYDLQNQTWGADDVQMQQYNQLANGLAFLFPDDPNLRLVLMPDAILQSFGTIFSPTAMSPDLPARRLDARLSLLIDGLEMTLGETPEPEQGKPASEVLRSAQSEDVGEVRERLEELLRRKPDLPELDTRDFFDECLRDVLARDYTEAQQAYVAGAFKAASVLAGGILEGMLLDAIARQPVVERERYTEATAGLPRLAGEVNWDRVNLAQLIQAAAQLGILGKSALRLIDGARDFRNALHPRAECREGTRAGKEEAELLLALVRLVYRDLSELRGRA